MTWPKRAVSPANKMWSKRAVTPESKMWSKRSVARMGTAWLVLSALALLAGCEEDSKPVPRGLLGADGQPAASARPQPSRPSSPPSAAPAAAAPKFQALPSGFTVPAARDPGSLQAPAKPAPPPPEAKPPRDLSSELARLIPAPSECLDLGLASAQGKAVISVSATVSPSGRLSSVAVTAPGQPPESIKCIQRAVARGVLPSDVPDAPVQVQANLSLEVVARPAPTPAAPPAKPTLPTLPSNVAQPENGEVAQPDGTEFAQPSQ